jgi:hypothetical protein
MMIVLDCGSKIRALPECSAPILAAVVFPGGAASHKLYGLGDDRSPLVRKHQKMDVIGCNRIIENFKTVGHLGLKEPIEPAFFVSVEF